MRNTAIVVSEIYLGIFNISLAICSRHEIPFAKLSNNLIMKSAFGFFTIRNGCINFNK